MYSTRIVVDLQTIVAPLVSDSETKKSIKSDRTRTSKSTVTCSISIPCRTLVSYKMEKLTSSRSKTSHSVIRPMQSCTLLLSPSEIWCMCLFINSTSICAGQWTYQSRSTSSNASSLSRRALCRYPPTESRKWETTISDRTTGLDAHSVPRYTTPLSSAIGHFVVCRATTYPRGVHKHILAFDFTRSSLCQSFSS